MEHPQELQGAPEIAPAPAYRVQPSSTLDGGWDVVEGQRVAAVRAGKPDAEALAHTLGCERLLFVARINELLASLAGDWEREAKLDRKRGAYGAAYARMECLRDVGRLGR